MNSQTANQLIKITEKHSKLPWKRKPGTKTHHLSSDFQEMISSEELNKMMVSTACSLNSSNKLLKEMLFLTNLKSTVITMNSMRITTSMCHTLSFSEFRQKVRLGLSALQSDSGSKKKSPYFHPFLPTREKNFGDLFNLMWPKSLSMISVLEFT